MKVGIEVYFDAAHSLPKYKGKCERFHGHTYKLEVTVEGNLGKEGMVIDFNELKKIVKEKILKELDHRNLNEIFDKPTAEKIAIWIFNKLEKEDGLPKIYSVKLWEGKSKWVLVERKEK